MPAKYESKMLNTWLAIKTPTANQTRHLELIDAIYASSQFDVIVKAVNEIAAATDSKVGNVRYDLGMALNFMSEVEAQKPVSVTPSGAALRETIDINTIATMVTAQVMEALKVAPGYQAENSADKKRNARRSSPVRLGQ